MSSGAVRLGELRGKVRVLKVACSKCGRTGQYRLSGLIERYGETMRLPDFAAVLASDCPNRQKLTYDRCDVSFPNLRQSSQ